MSSPELFMYAALAVVGVSFLLGRNPTAAALVVSWLICEAIYRSGLEPTDYALFFDIAVITVIFCKPRRSLADWFILFLFPAAWSFYIAEPSHLKNWMLYGFQMAQFIAAGADSFVRFCRSRAVSDTPDKPPFGASYRLAWGWGYG